MIGVSFGFGVVIHTFLGDCQLSVGVIGDSDRLDSALLNLEPRNSDQ